MLIVGEQEEADAKVSIRKHGGRRCWKYEFGRFQIIFFNQKSIRCIENQVILNMEKLDCKFCNPKFITIFAHCKLKKGG